MELTRERFGPWALILGGSEGIGAHMALLLGQTGINSLLIARKAAPLAETRAMIEGETGASVRTLSLDITAPTAFERVAEAAADIEVGLLVHNVAGGTHFGSFVESPLDHALDMVNANVAASLRLVHRFGQPMADRGRGGILFIGSFGGVTGSALLAAYSASKAFTQVFSEALWAELAPRGVSVLSFLIGLTDTPSYRRSGAVDRNNAHVADPQVVARQALAALAVGEGPVTAAPENREYLASLYRMDRKEAVELKRRFMTNNHPNAK